MHGTVDLSGACFNSSAATLWLSPIEKQYGGQGVFAPNQVPIAISGYARRSCERTAPNAGPNMASEVYGAIGVGGGVASALFEGLLGGRYEGTRALVPGDCASQYIVTAPGTVAGAPHPCPSVDLSFNWTFETAPTDWIQHDGGALAIHMNPHTHQVPGGPQIAVAGVSDSACTPWTFPGFHAFDPVLSDGVGAVFVGPGAPFGQGCQFGTGITGMGIPGNFVNVSIIGVTASFEGQTVVVRIYYATQLDGWEWWAFSGTYGNYIHAVGTPGQPGYLGYQLLQPDIARSNSPCNPAGDCLLKG